MSIRINPHQILAHLNNLGFHCITTQELQDFIKDLKKLIKYDQMCGVPSSFNIHLNDDDLAAPNPACNDFHSGGPENQHLSEETDNFSCGCQRDNQEECFGRCSIKDFSTQKIYDISVETSHTRGERHNSARKKHNSTVKKLHSTKERHDSAMPFHDNREVCFGSSSRRDSSAQANYSSIINVMNSLKEQDYSSVETRHSPGERLNSSRMKHSSTVGKHQFTKKWLDSAMLFRGNREMCFGRCSRKDASTETNCDSITNSLEEQDDSSVESYHSLGERHNSTQKEHNSTEEKLEFTKESHDSDRERENSSKASCYTKNVNHNFVKVNCNLRRKEKHEGNKPKSCYKTQFIKPWELHAQTTTVHRRSDPVALYHKYQTMWKHQKFPGEDKRHELRWNVREKMIGVVPEPQPINIRATSVDKIFRTKHENPK